MDEYIKREEALALVRQDAPEDEKASVTIATAKKLVRNIVLRTPAADVVLVVRCMDCKYYKPQKKSAHWENRTNYCNRIVTIKVQPYDFCSYGERKEGADKG